MVTTTKANLKSADKKGNYYVQVEIYSEIFKSRAMSIDEANELHAKIVGVKK